MKKNILQSLAPGLNMLIAFVVAMTASYFLVSHFQHTLLRAWVGTTTEVGQTEASTPSSDYALNEEQVSDVGCGCPFCCGAAL